MSNYPPSANSGSSSNGSNFSKHLNESNTSVKGQGNATSESKRKFNLNTPSFQPSVQNLTRKFGGLLPKVKDIPTFVPSNLESSSPANSDANSSFGGRKFNASTPSFTPANPYDSFPVNSGTSDFSLEGFSTHESNNSGTVDLMPLSQIAQSTTPKIQQNPYLSNPGTPGTGSMTHSANPASAFMFHGQGAPNYPLNYHLYSPAPPPRVNMNLSPHETNVNALFIPNDLRETITKRNEASLQSLSHLSLPDHVGRYHSLVPIDTTFDLESKVYGKPTAVYKVLSNVDGNFYALRRIDLGSLAQLSSEQAFINVKKWRRLTNPNVVRLKDAFTSVSFDSQEPCLCLVYDYYPLSNTLQEQHITRKLGVKLEPISENLLWIYLIQLVGALISIHKEGLYAGLTLSISKVIVTNKNRLRLAGVCMDDILKHDAVDDLNKKEGKEKVTAYLQRQDITLLGNLMIELASTMLPAFLRGPFDETFESRLKSSNRPCSDELFEVLKILNEPSEEFSLTEFYTKYLSLRSLEVLNAAQDLTDYYEGHLLSEVENGRLFRLMAKLTSVLDQPASDAELGGNAFVLKLFRDFVFHGRDEAGKPAVDLSRILINLNKLDVGVDEKILLVSSEEDTCMIVTYKEVKDILELSFRALFRSN